MHHQLRALPLALAILCGCPTTEPPPPDDRLATDCVTSAWDALPANADIVWVQAGGSGEGSLEAPFGTINEALAAATSGLIAVGDGSYPELLRLDSSHDGLRLVGACPEQVTLDLAASGDEPGVLLQLAANESVELAGMTLADSGSNAVYVESGGLVAHDLVVADYYGRGLHAVGPDASLVLDRITIQDGDNDDSPETGGGIRINNGAQVTGRDILITDPYIWGVHLRDGGAAGEFTNLEVRGSRSARSGPAGATGTATGVDSSLVLTDSLMTGNMGSGVFAWGGTTTLEDVEIRDTLAASDGVSNGAVALIQGAALEMNGGTISGAFGIGLYMSDANTSAELTDVVIQDIAVDVQGWTGYGVRVESPISPPTPADAPRLTITGGRILDTDNSGLATASTADAVIVVQGLEITNAGRLGEGDSGDAIIVSSGSFDGADLHLHHNRMHGLEALFEGTTVTVRDSLIEAHETLPDFTSAGVFAYEGASVTLIDTELRDNASSGVIAWSGAEVTLEGGVVHGQVSSQSTTAGRGLHAELGALISATGTELYDNEGPGLIVTAGGRLECIGCDVHHNQFAGAFNGGGELTLIDTRLADSTLHGTEPGVFGLYAENIFGSLDVVLDGCTIEGNASAGIALEQPFPDEGRMAVQILDTTVEGGEADDDQPDLASRGDAVLVCGGLGPWDGTDGVLISGSTLHDAGRVGLLLNGSGATLQDVTLDGNAVSAVQQPVEAVDGSLDGVDGAQVAGVNLPYNFLIECPGFEFTDVVPPAN